jgi:hypothetical protein
LLDNGKLQFLNPEDRTVTVEIEDYNIVDSEWWSFLVEKNVNRNIEITEESSVK